MENQKVLILNFGGQYDQLIARRVRECNVYCEVKPYTMSLDEIRAFGPIGIIFTGGPDSVYAENSYHPAETFLSWGSPFSAFATAASSSRTTWAAALQRRRVTRPENTERLPPSLMLPVRCSAACRKPASPG